MKEKLKNAQVKEGVFWVDEMRVGLIGETRRVWAPRGLKVEQEREYVYKWSYLNLAVNGVSGELYWTWTQDMKAASIAPVVKHWTRRGVEAVVWESALL